MTRKLISVSRESFEKLEILYPGLSMNERVEKLIDQNTYLEDRINELQKIINSLQNQKISQRDEDIKQIKINTDKILEYLIKPGLNGDQKSEKIVLSLPVEKESVLPVYNTIDDIILDQKLIDNVTKAYQEIGGNLVDKKIQDALYIEKEKIFNKNQQPI